MCQQCLTPMTAYSGQLTGETYQGKLAGQVALLNTRPAAVTAMVIFQVLFAVFPLVVFAHYLPGPANTNPDEAYQASMSSAFHVISAVVAGFVMIPLSVVMLWVAWSTWAQRTWAYNAVFAPLSVFVIIMLTKFGQPSTTLHVVAGFSIAAIAVLVFFWYRPTTRAWFGL
jgi:uncharacterized membrane protein